MINLTNYEQGARTGGRTLKIADVESYREQDDIRHRTSGLCPHTSSDTNPHTPASLVIRLGTSSGASTRQQQQQCQIIIFFRFDCFSHDQGSYSLARSGGYDRTGAEATHTQTLDHASLPQKKLPYVAEATNKPLKTSELGVLKSKIAPSLDPHSGLAFHISSHV